MMVLSCAPIFVPLTLASFRIIGYELAQHLRDFHIIFEFLQVIEPPNGRSHQRSAGAIHHSPIFGHSPYPLMIDVPKLKH